MGSKIVRGSLAIYAVSIFIFNIHGFVLSGDLSKGTVIEDFGIQTTTIGHFARHVLCKNYEGKRNLYTAMKQKVCDISLSMIQKVVLDLCRRKDHMLNKWVAELFDIDGNGYISHFEKHYYT